MPMWVSILYDSSRDYFIKYNNVNSEYTFNVTNLKYLWECNFSKKELLSLIKECNPLLEGDSDQLIPQCLESLFNGLAQSSTENKIEFENETQNVAWICVKILREKFPFKIKLKFQMSSPLKFYEEVTLSLITMIKELKESEERLIDCIRKKDEEIADYRAGGACLSLNHLETKVFNECEHRKSYTPSSNCYFNCENLLTMTNFNFTNESTPKHSIAHKGQPVSSIKKEMKKDTGEHSAVSSPSLREGIAPIFLQNNDDLNEVNNESILQNHRRRKVPRKQLNL